MISHTAGASAPRQSCPAASPARRPLLAQCTRYLSSDRLRALIVVGEKAFHLPETLCGKPLIAFGVNRLWGVAMP